MGVLPRADAVLAPQGLSALTVQLRLYDHAEMDARRHGAMRRWSCLRRLTSIILAGCMALLTAVTAPQAQGTFDSSNVAVDAGTLNERLITVSAGTDTNTGFSFGAGHFSHLLRVDTANRITAANGETRACGGFQDFGLSIGSRFESYSSFLCFPLSPTEGAWKV